jgi:hypothetical protein
MDRLTYEGLTTGMVTLPRRTVHVRRVAPAPADPAGRRQHGREPGRPPVRRRPRGSLGRHRPAGRAGLNVWRPYERFDSRRQQAMLEAAATALALAASGEVAARVTLGPLLTREPHRDVHEGDRRAWEQKQARAELDAMISRARTDPDTARRLTEMFTVGSRTIAGFYRERQYLICLGIPDGLLPDHRDSAALISSSDLLL